MIAPLPDLGLLATETVYVLRDVVVRDDLGEPTVTDTERVEVPGCIVQPGATSDMDASRPNGVEVAMTVYMADPGESLRGCRIEARGREYGVIGDPQPSTAPNVPGGRNLTVEVTWADG